MRVHRYQDREKPTNRHGQMEEMLSHPKKGMRVKCLTIYNIRKGAYREGECGWKSSKGLLLFVLGNLTCPVLLQKFE